MNDRIVINSIIFDETNNLYKKSVLSILNIIFKNIFLSLIRIGFSFLSQFGLRVVQDEIFVNCLDGAGSTKHHSSPRFLCQYLKDIPHTLLTIDHAKRNPLPKMKKSASLI